MALQVVDCRVEIVTRKAWPGFKALLQSLANRTRTQSSSVPDPEFQQLLGDAPNPGLGNPRRSQVLFGKICQKAHYTGRQSRKQATQLLDSNEIFKQMPHHGKHSLSDQSKYHQHAFYSWKSPLGELHYQDVSPFALRDDHSFSVSSHPGYEADLNLART